MAAWGQSYFRLRRQFAEIKRRQAARLPRGRDWPAILTTASTIAIALATVATVVVAALLWDALHNTDLKIGRQLALIEAEQRPWIRVDHEIFGDLDLRKGWGMIPVTLIATNVGKTPAFNVEFASETFVLADGNTDLYESQRKRCEVPRKNRQSDKSGVINAGSGTLIFPGASERSERFGGIIGTGPRPQDLEKFSREESGARVVDLWVFGCVTYNLGRPETVRQTGFVFRIARIVKRSGMTDALTFSSPLDMVVPKEDLRLYPTASADGLTN